MPSKRKPKPVELTITLDADVYSALRAIAKATKRTRQHVVNDIIRSCHAQFMPKIQTEASSETQSES